MTGEFDEIEELKALERRLEDTRLRRRQLEERQRQLEDRYISYDTPEELKELAELAENAVQSQNFREQFCQFYNKRLTRTTADIVEGVIGITLGANIPLALVAFIVIKLLRTRLDEYCDRTGETERD